MPRLGENCLNQAIWLLVLDVKRRDVTQRFNCNESTMTWLRFLTHLNMNVHLWLQGDLTSIPTSPHFGIGFNQPLVQSGEHSASTGMWKHNFMQHSNKTKILVPIPRETAWKRLALNPDDPRRQPSWRRGISKSVFDWHTILMHSIGLPCHETLLQSSTFGRAQKKD